MTYKPYTEWTDSELTAAVTEQGAAVWGDRTADQIREHLRWFQHRADDETGGFRPLIVDPFTGQQRGRDSEGGRAAQGSNQGAVLDWEPFFKNPEQR